MFNAIGPISGRPSWRQEGGVLPAPCDRGRGRRGTIPRTATRVAVLLLLQEEAQ